MYNYYRHLQTYLIIKKKEFLNSIHQKSSQYTPFVILCEPRTGSTFLHTCLNFHSNIKSYGEVIREQVEKNHNGCLLKLEEDLFKPHASHLKAIGFKLFYFYYDHPSYANIFRQVIERKEIKVIHLLREDIFKLYVSLKIAQRTNIWSASSKNADKKKQRIFVNPDEFRQFAETYIQRQQFFKKLFQSHEIINVTYENLTKDSQQELEKIQQFLGAKTQVLQSLLQKQTSDDLEREVVNYDEVIGPIRQILKTLEPNLTLNTK
jgi:LPS sulfotransferase NodH